MTKDFFLFPFVFNKKHPAFNIYSKRLLLSFIVVLLSAPVVCALDNADCLSCHDDSKIKSYDNSVHAPGLLCVSCHKDISELPHSEKPAKVDCASCHSEEFEFYNASDHAKALRAGIPAANCFDCHGDAHAILGSSNPESPIYHLNIPKMCAKCHEDEKKMAQYNLLEKAPILTYSVTVHGRAVSEKGSISAAVCSDCHGSHDLLGPLNPKSKIYKFNVPGTCGKCHKEILNTYLRSIHGTSVTAGNSDAPVCTDCHGEHAIKSRKDPASSVYATIVSKKTCGQCHAAERVTSKYHLPSDRLETYFQSYHGLAGRFGVTTVANCASCHGIHDILPSSDPRSSVYKGNLAHTCGKCHEKAGAKLIEGSVHLAPSPLRDKAVYYVSWFYILLIILTIAGMLAHNILDFSAKFKVYYRRRKEEDKNIRFTASERFQHLVLVISFILLAYSGFALRYHNAWWALPFTTWNPGFDWRGIIHRIMAILFSGLLVYHVYYLSFTKRGREQFKALLPRRKDFTYFFKISKYYLGIDKEKPKEVKCTYVEKVEYWALIWGTVIMLLTGSILTFENFFLQYFPKWILDVARVMHYYEAILAVSAILIWHLYFVIFDPDQYPLNLSMITGKTSKEEREEGGNREG